MKVTFVDVNALLMNIYFKSSNFAIVYDVVQRNYFVTACGECREVRDLLKVVVV